MVEQSSQSKSLSTSIGENFQSSTSSMNKFETEIAIAINQLVQANNWSINQSTHGLVKEYHTVLLYHRNQD